jgi:hypothetical protein
MLFVLLAAIPSGVTAQRIWGAFPDSIVTPNRATVLQDYIVMWVSGRTALSGQTSLLATTPTFNTQIAALIQPGLDMVYWVYPPTMMLFSAPLALLPPLPSMALWTILTLGVLWAALRLTGLPLFARAMVMWCPAVLENGLDGQNGALLAACAIGGITQAQRRPWLAGLCMSVAVLKPQMAVVAPVCALAAWHWRAILCAGLFASAWITAAALCFGSSVWVDYVTSILPIARTLFLQFDRLPFGTLYFQELMVTPFAAFRAAGSSTSAAQALQLAVTVLVLGGVARFALEASRAGAPPPLGLALASIPLATPYAMSYDMIGPAVAAALLLQSRPSTPLRVVAALAWVWPGLAIYVGALVTPGLGALVFAGLVAAVLIGARRPDKGAASPDVSRGDPPGDRFSVPARANSL